MQHYEETEFCKNCQRKTPSRTEREYLKGSGVFLKVRIYCKECGQLARQVDFK